MSRNFQNYPERYNSRPVLDTTNPRVYHQDISQPNDMTLQLQALENGFAVVDMGRTGQKIQGFRYLVTRMADNAIYHENTAKDVRALWA